MHAGAFFQPGHHPQLLIGLIVAAVALLVLAAAAPDLASLELSLGGDGASSASSPATGAGAASGSWVTDPLAPPVDLVRGN